MKGCHSPKTFPAGLQPELTLHHDQGHVPTHIVHCGQRPLLPHSLTRWGKDTDSLWPSPCP